MGEIVIATTTFYKDIKEVRPKLALMTMEKCQKRGYQIMVVDGGSDKNFRDKACSNPAVIFKQSQKGVGASRREALSEAAKIAGDDGAIVWMEPEKHPFIDKLQKPASFVIKKRFDLITLGRKKFHNYPPEQKLGELFVNYALKQFTGLNWDFCFGPFITSQKGIKFFLDYNGEYGDSWDSTIIPRLRILKAGLKVKYLKVDYVHSSAQTKEETGNPIFIIKRLEQMNNVILAFRKETQPKVKKKFS